MRSSGSWTSITWVGHLTNKIVLHENSLAYANLLAAIIQQNTNGCVFWNWLILTAFTPVDSNIQVIIEMALTIIDLTIHKPNKTDAKTITRSRNQLSYNRFPRTFWNIFITILFQKYVYNSLVTEFKVDNVLKNIWRIRIASMGAFFISLLDLYIGLKVRYTYVWYQK